MALQKEAAVSLMLNVVVFIIVLVTLLILEYVLAKRVDPVFRGFYCNDDSIRYPYQDHPAVPTWSLFVFSIFVPLAVIIGGTLYATCIKKQEKSLSRQPLSCGRVRVPRAIIRPISWYLWCLVGLGLTIIFTDTLKMSSGELRPHFLAICDPDWSLVNCTDEFNNYIYVTNYTCRGDPDMVRAARLSFPSGHSSTVSFTMIFIVLYISTIPLIRLRSPFQLLVMGFFFILIFLVASSRITDNWHHFRDVIVGIIMGAFIAVVVVYYNTRYFGRCGASKTMEHCKKDVEVAADRVGESECGNDEPL